MPTLPLLSDVELRVDVLGSEVKHRYVYFTLYACVFVYLSSFHDPYGTEWV
jgi:hypothetical protein